MLRRNPAHDHKGEAAVILQYVQLQRPRHVFADGKTSTGAFQGLRQFGPYSGGDCPPEPTTVFVYPKELREQARKLYLSLRDGIGPFKGTMPLLRYPLPSSKVIRVDEFTTSGLNEEDSAARYKEAVESWLASGGKADIALILHPKTERENQRNPYLTSKFPLLRSGIPSQVVTTDLLAKKDVFEWSAATIALAMLAKMGGVPWGVQSELPEDTIIVGVNRAVVRGASGALLRHYGFASTFSHQGVYLGTRLFTPADSKQAYLSGLERALTDALEDWRSDAGDVPANLVIHVRKELSWDETTILERVLSSAPSSLVRSYAVLKIVDAQEALIWNPNQKDNQLPPAGVLVRLTGRRGLLQVTGISDDSSAGKLVSHPFSLKLLANSPSAPAFEVLAENVLAMAAMNWRALNAEAIPVSIRYPQLVAELLGRFHESGFDVSELPPEVMRRPWFL